MLYFSVYLLACWSVIFAITRGLFPGASLTVVGIALYTVVPLFVFIRRLRWEFYPGAIFRTLVVRVLLYTQLVLPFVTIAAITGALLGWPFGASLIVSRIVAGGMLAAAFALFLIGYFGSRSLVVRDVTIDIPDLPSGFDGLRIAQLSDLHVGPQSSKQFLARVVKNVRDINPDLIAVTGDLIDDRPEDVAVYASHLRELNAPLGVFMIAGNHDVYAGWPLVRSELERLVPGHVLVNESHIIERNGDRVAIVGTGDPAGMQRGVGDTVGPDMEKAFRSVPSGMMAIVLAHNPALWPAILPHKAAVTLSGHTHWGQFAFPKRNWSLASRFLKHAMGLYREGDSVLYISPGTGYWGLPFRIGALPEVTAVTLRKASTAAMVMGDVRRAS